ncbi:phage tail protein [Pseudooceanicola atlanticus]|uniref:phage tail protein n=1 Tax=Pseudooceanicola atlanticus TaxID=1461694 RepID=UPI002354FD42|nr:tail fiber protein [Pseudooceanicola atlanticus]
MAEVVIPDLERYRRRTRNYDIPADNMSDVVEAVQNALSPVGSIVPTLSATEPGEGWKLCNGQALSRTEYPTLFAMIGNTFGGGPGDTFNLPDLRGRTVFGAGGGTAFTLLALAGAAQQTISVDQLPAHGHGVTDPGHTHTFTGTPHNHGVTDPGHTHTSAEVDAATGTAGAAQDGATSGSTGSATTGITIDNATAGGTNSDETTGVTVDETGGGQPFDIIPPVVAVNWMIRT